MSDRYVITVAVASPSNPGRCVGAWMVRLGERARLQVANDLGECSTHRAALLTIAQALAAPRARRYPITVRTNQKAVVQGVERALGNAGLGHEDSDPAVAGVVAAVRAARERSDGVTFEHTPNATGDADLLAARDAAGEVSRQRRAPA